jgi:hypothetical protein
MRFERRRQGAALQRSTAAARGGGDGDGSSSFEFKVSYS